MGKKLHVVQEFMHARAPLRVLHAKRDTQNSHHYLAAFVHAARLSAQRLCSDVIVTTICHLLSSCISLLHISTRRNCSISFWLCWFPGRTVLLNFFRLSAVGLLAYFETVLQSRLEPTTTLPRHEGVSRILACSRSQLLPRKHHHMFITPASCFERAAAVAIGLNSDSPVDSTRND